jgi:hypothetical protein
MGLQILWRLGELPHLRELEIIGYEDGFVHVPNYPRLFHVLVGANLTGLQSLVLAGVLLCDEDVITLATAPPALWASLETLQIIGGGGDTDTFCVEGIVQAAAPHLTKLRMLEIATRIISVHGAQLLQRAAPLLSEVRTVLLGNSRYSGPNSRYSGAVATLLRAAWNKSLEKLSLSYIGSDGAHALAMAAPGLPQMRDFCLYNADAGHDAGLVIVQAAVEHWPLLERLCLINIILDARAARVLGSASRLSRLRLLCLRDNALGSEGGAALLNGGAAWLGTLERMELHGNFGHGMLPQELEEKEAARMLINAAPCLVSLTELTLTKYHSPLEVDIKSQLIRAFPRVSVTP